MKKDKLFIKWSLILLLILSIFFWAIWNSFLQNIVSWKWTYFTSYDSFREKVNSGFLVEELPRSAYNIRYYWGNRNFVRLGGYGASLSEDEYIFAKQETLQRYKYNMYDKISSEEFYLYDENQDMKWLTKEYIITYDIIELEKLILEEEKIGDYYVIASYVYDGGPVNYYDCVLCNDKLNRIIEISRTNRNPQ